VRNRPPTEGGEYVLEQKARRQTKKEEAQASRIGEEQALAKAKESRQKAEQALEKAEQARQNAEEELRHKDAELEQLKRTLEGLRDGKQKEQ
jgi:hypothetical protein